MLTISDVERALPSQLKTKVSQQMVDELNNLSVDPQAAETMRDNFISYTSVMTEGRFKLHQYVEAVVYVSYKMMGYTAHEAYSRTYPERYARLVAKGATEKDISAYVAGVNKNKLVNLILERTLIPIWVLNQDLVQRAINTQADLMMNAKSEMVRMQAANSLLAHIKKPETQKVELSMDLKDTSGMQDLRDKLSEMATTQQELISKGGYSTKDIAHQSLVKPEVVDAEVIE
jgi:hypothetical protein